MGCYAGRWKKEWLRKLDQVFRPFLPEGSGLSEGQVEGTWETNTSIRVNSNWSRCGTLGHLELCPFVEFKAFNRTGTDEVSLSADVRHGQNREDNVSLWTMCPRGDPLDNETLEAPHSSLNLLFSYFSVKCRFSNLSTIVLNCFRVVISGRMGKQMYFMPRENPEDEVAMKPKIICSTT